ncbi:MAG: lipopolysaccharide biosynthesis protein [Chitinophagaceae bacterium]
MYKDFLKSIFLYGLAGSIGKFIGLLLMPIYVRIFSPEEYGIIDLIQTVVIIISLLGMLLLESSIQRYYFEVKDDQLRKKYISTTFWTVSVLSVLWLLISALFSKPLSVVLFHDEKYYLSIIVAAVGIPLSNLFVFSTVIIRYMKLPVAYLVIVLVQLLLTILFTIWFVIYLKLGIIGVFYAQVLGLLIAVAASLYRIRSTLQFYWNKELILGLFRFSIPQFPARVGSIANAYFNRFIMLSYLSLTDIGLFTIAAKIASGFQLIENAFSLSWYPFFYEQFENNAEHRKVFVKISQYVTLLVFGLAILVSFFSKEILMLLTTKDYYSATPIIGILILANALIIVKYPIDLGPLISKKTIYGTYIYLFSAAVNIISLFVLVPSIGLMGVALSLLISYFTLLVTSWVVSEKLYHIGFNREHFAVSFAVALLTIFITTYFDLNIVVKCVLSLALCVTGYFLFTKNIRYILNRKK